MHKNRNPKINKSLSREVSPEKKKKRTKKKEKRKKERKKQTERNATDHNSQSPYCILSKSKKCRFLLSRKLGDAKKRLSQNLISAKDTVFSANKHVSIRTHSPKGLCLVIQYYNME